MTPDAFPDTATIRNKLAEFESYFLQCFLDRFQRLPALNQLSSLAVAMRPDRAHQYVSLLQYLESDTISVDLGQRGGREAAGSAAGAVGETAGLGGRREFFLTVSPSAFEQLQVCNTCLNRKIYFDCRQ